MQPGEEKSVTFTLDKRSFAYYDEELADWYVESGEFTILVGKSSSEIELSKTIYVKSTVERPFHVHRNTTIGDILSNPKVAPVAQKLLAEAQKDSPFGNASSGDDEDAGEMIAAMMKYMPIRALSNFSNGQLTEEKLQEMIRQLNAVAQNG
ncbi:fibronectin type III-like domain-contianing protein [Bacillus sp. JCM 19034]|uniref:fibronectin type III-like domain-contianing protein n=1 Tax=Bacillus sp. JCM 19034 TaxID=1481928 RepID=UPI000A5EEC6B